MPVLPAAPANAGLAVVTGATGGVGSEFLQQVVDSKRLLTDASLAGKREAASASGGLNIDYRVTAVARNKQMRLSYDGIDVSGDPQSLLSADDDVSAEYAMQGDVEA